MWPHHRFFGVHTKTTTAAMLFIPSLCSSQTLTLRSFRTLITLTSNPITLFTSPQLPQQPVLVQPPRFSLTLCRFSHSSTSSPISTTALEFFCFSSNSVVAKCISSFSSSSSSSPSVSVADTMEWDEPAACSEVDDSGDDGVRDEDVRPSIPVRAYFFSTSVDLRSLVEQNKPNFIPPTSCMTNYIVLRFGSTKPELIGLGASISGSDCSHMVVFQYGSIVLFNVRDHEIDGYLKIVEKHASGLLHEMRKDVEVSAQHGLGVKTLEHFEQMMKTGIEPNAATFLCVLTACSHAGLLEKGQHYFQMMKQSKIEPEVSHYVTMVDLLGRAGLFDRAESFIREMPIEPTAAIWGALLGACRMHNKMGLGAYAAERVFELDPHDSGPHILLYNIYASAGKWSEASKVRKFMKEIGVKKEPACSWVEIENAVHMFVANDNAHPQKDEISMMWEKISTRIKEIGYIPNTSHVPLFVDQQEEKRSYSTTVKSLLWHLHFSRRHQGPPSGSRRTSESLAIVIRLSSLFPWWSRERLF